MKIISIELFRMPLIILLLGCEVSGIMAQEIDSSQSMTSKDLTTLNDEDFQALSLPPIDTFFVNAAKGPGIQLFDLRIEEQKELLKKEKRTWSSFFSVGSGYSYGNVGMYSSYSDLATPLFSQYSGNSQTSWQVGANISISLETLLDLLPRIKRQNIAIEMVEMERGKALDELRSSVVDLYVNAKLRISLLKLQAQALVYANAMFKMVEQDFLNGQKDQSDLSNAKSNQSNAQVSYEESKSSLINALLKLEIYTRTPIHKRTKK